MNQFDHIVHKFILILCCFCYAIVVTNTDNLVIPLLIVVIYLSITGIFRSKILTIIFFILFLIGSCFFPAMMFFIPAVAYDLFLEKAQLIIALGVVPVLLQVNAFGDMLLILMCALTALSYILKHNSYNLKVLSQNYIKLRDDTKEREIALDKLNKELLEKQDYEVNLATLNERNRIAREIHDNIGHMLSRSILQVGALLAITKDEVTKEALGNVKEALTSGMDSIRNSIHNIHEDSIDLETKLNSIVHEFTFCDISFSYHVTNDFTIKAKYSILYIVKEALNNVIKHSNATKVTISVNEHQNTYQIVISDNGTKTSSGGSSGSMGINSMQDRVSSIGGTMHIDKDTGYQILITLPIEGSKP